MPTRHTVTSNTRGAMSPPRIGGVITADPSPAVAFTLYFLDASGGAFTITLPPTPADGDEIYLCEIAGSQNLITLDAGGNEVFPPWGLENGASTNPIQIEQLIAGWRFYTAFGAWKPIFQSLSLRKPTGSIVNATGQPHAVGQFQPFRYDGSATFTLNLPPGDLAQGQEAAVMESAGSGAGTVTVSGNGRNLVNDAGASVASMTLSLAYAFRRWVWTGSLWQMISRAP